jgi:hypothetical protein
MPLVANIIEPSRTIHRWVIRLRDGVREVMESLRTTWEFFPACGRNLHIQGKLGYFYRAADTTWPFGFCDFG